MGSIEHERELLRAVEPAVRENLRYLSGDKTWLPSDILPNLEDPDYASKLHEFRESAGRLSDSSLVVLAGNAITEEANPSYAMNTQYNVMDGTGVSNSPWARWQRGWNAEENLHSQTLDRFLLLTGRVDMKEIERSIYTLISNGLKQDPGPIRRIAYPLIQEPATFISHSNMGKIALGEGEENLERILKKIAGHEARHAKFYLNVYNAVMDEDPDTAIIRLYELMRSGMVMPAELMQDSNYDPTPQLFHKFAGVAQHVGIFTTEDYLGIFDDVMGKLKVADRKVYGEAAKAQEALLTMSDSIRKRTERIAKRRSIEHEPRPFAWIYNRFA